MKPILPASLKTFMLFMFFKFSESKSRFDQSEHSAHRLRWTVAALAPKIRMNVGDSKSMAGRQWFLPLRHGRAQLKRVLRIHVKIRSLRSFRPTAKVNHSCPCTQNPNECLSYQVNGRKTMIRDFEACSLFYLFINNSLILNESLKTFMLIMFFKFSINFFFFV